MSACKHCYKGLCADAAHITAASMSDDESGDDGMEINSTDNSALHFFDEVV